MKLFFKSLFNVSKYQTRKSKTQIISPPTRFAVKSRRDEMTMAICRKKHPKAPFSKPYAFFSPFSGSIRDSTTDKTKTPPTIPRETGEGIWYQGETIIFRPMNVRMIASP